MCAPQTANAPRLGPDWDMASGALGCNGCHGDAVVDYPNYANDTVVDAGAGNQTKKNSHGSHSTFTCNHCHNATTTDGSTIDTVSNHTNKAWDLAQGGGETFTVNVQGEIDGDTYAATNYQKGE